MAYIQSCDKWPWKNWSHLICFWEWKAVVSAVISGSSIKGYWSGMMWWQWIQCSIVSHKRLVITVGVCCLWKWVHKTVRHHDGLDVDIGHHLGIITHDLYPPTIVDIQCNIHHVYCQMFVNIWQWARDCSYPWRVDCMVQWLSNIVLYLNVAMQCCCRLYPSILNHNQLQFVTIQWDVHAWEVHEQQVIWDISHYLGGAMK